MTSDRSPAADRTLSVSRLGLRYGTATIFADLTLQVPAGELTALIGPSGCGKTSFLMCLNRLIDLVPEAFVTGRVTFGDLDVLHPATDVVGLRRRVGMIFQKPNPFPLSIRRNLELPLREHGMRRKDEVEHRIETALKDVGLWKDVEGRLDRSALKLSGGQQQRLCLARALVLQPEVLLLDEPCSALDPISTRAIEDLLATLQQRLTLLAVTHNLGQARRIADQVVVFWPMEGVARVIETGPADQVFESPQNPLTRAYVTGRTG